MSFFKKNKKQFIPSVHTPFAREISKRRNKFFFLFLSFLLLGFLYSKTYIAKQTVEQDLVEVLVTTEKIEAYTPLSDASFESKKIPRKFLPQGIFLTNPKNEAEPLVSQFHILKNQVLVQSQFFSDAPQDSISVNIKKDKGFLINEDWFESEIPAITKNDKIDILATNPKLSYDKTFFVVQNVLVSDVIINEKNKKRSVLLELTDDQSKLLLFSRGNKLPMALLIHSSSS